ncbi:hypothetical protein ACQSGA_26875 [Salmonella enterica]|uniref:hypothetical protein n=1 Tax=Salmonella enterica TaxID=28901 RepID=UPI003D32063F
MDLETPRLKLEPYDDSHYEGLRVMDSDAVVMRYITGGIVKTVTNGAKVIHIRRLKSDPGVNLLS